MATWPGDSAQQTTQARTIETLDGYVSRGRDPPSSVPRDHAILQSFAAYLELRLKSQNLSILRRIFADFLNEQENTLVPMMQQGCTIVTIFPVLRTSAPRLRKAKYLLSNPSLPSTRADASSSTCSTARSRGTWRCLSTRSSSSCATRRRRCSSSWRGGTR